MPIVMYKTKICLRLAYILLPLMHSIGENEICVRLPPDAQPRAAERQRTDRPDRVPDLVFPDGRADWRLRGQIRCPGAPGF